MMNPKILPFLVLFAMLASFGGGYSFAMIRNKQALAQFEKEHTVLPGIDTSWRSDFSGTIMDIKNTSVTLQTGTQTISLNMPADLAVSQLSFAGTQQQAKTLTASDLKKGDVMLVSVITDSQGNMQIERIALFEAPTTQ